MCSNAAEEARTAEPRFFTINRTCEFCGAKGILSKHPEKHARQGQRQDKKKLKIKIPPASTQEQVEGAARYAAGRDTTPGDLYIVLQVKEHSVFERAVMTSPFSRRRLSYPLPWR
jgi:DnaJ-class molecular chaperone